MGNMLDAEKGYEIVAELFPTLSAGKKSKSRLKEIRQNKESK